MDSSSCIVAFVILLKKRVSVVTPEVKIQGRKQSTPGLFLMAWNFTPEYPGDKLQKFTSGENDRFPHDSVQI
jgi:hypothetical protein